MVAVKHNGQLAVQCLSSFPGPVFSNSAHIALESFGQKPLYCTWSVEMPLILEDLRPGFPKTASEVPAAGCFLPHHLQLSWHSCVCGKGADLKMG